MTRDPPATYEAFHANQLTPTQLEHLFLEDRATLETWMKWQAEAATMKARAITDATLTEDWRRLIGPASRLVETLMQIRAEGESETGQSTTGHVFATQDALAARVGVTARTLRNWLSKAYSGSRWLECWVSRRTWYVTREDGNRSRGGTVWRVSLEPRGCNDLTKTPAVSYDALRTPWRSWDELPGATRGTAIASVLEDKGKAIAPEENVPTKQGRFEIRVEGRHRTLMRVTDSRSGFHSGNAAPITPARAQFAQAWAKAESLAVKLGDSHSTGFWFAQFRRLEIAGSGDGAIWSAAGQALEMRAQGLLTKATAAGYAVGILKRTARA
jgi:hypothetical protein